MDIQKTTLGTTEEKISCLGLGTMYFGTKVKEDIAFRLMDMYAHAGGTFLDSANKYASWVPGYQGGESELIIGKWLKQKQNRQKMFLSTKVGFPYGDVPLSLKKQVIISECEKSLKRLGVEVIDLYFAHTYDAETPVDETMEAFYQLKKTGKIRFAGASNYYGWQLLESNTAAATQGWEGFCFLQQRHTYLEPTLRANFGTQLLLTPEIKALCESKKMTIMAYSPLLGGVYVKDHFPIPIQYQTALTDLRIKNLIEVAKELHVSPNAVVLAWMLQGEHQVIPLVTGSTVAQMEENMQVLSIKLSDVQLSKLNHEMVQPNKY